MIKSKVIIFTEGGEKIGFGHITRCIALSQAIEDKGYASELIVNADDSILDFIEDRNYQIFDWITEQGKLTGLIKDADFVIIDSYLAEKRIYDKISKITDGNLLMIDDCCRLEYPRGIVVNPSIYGDKLNYPQKDRVTYLLGKDYIILRKEFWEVPHKKINIEIKNILITFGRVKCGNLIDRIANFFKDNFKFRVHIVGSDSNKLSAKQMLELMLKTDICISGGGQTIYELARVGVPTIGICFAENQMLNLKNWMKIGFMNFVGWNNEENVFERIKNIIHKMDYNKRFKMSQVGRKFVNGQGAIRVVEKITHYVMSRDVLFSI